MPCYTEPHSYCEHSKGECIEKGNELLVKFYTDQIEHYKKQSNLTTRLLCYACRQLSPDWCTLKFKNEELQEWWERHKKFDEQRVQPGER